MPIKKSAPSKPHPAEETLVVIRVWRASRETYNNEVFALFPAQLADADGHCDSYERHGHSAADYFKRIAASRPATPGEQAKMLQMLTRAGYENVRVIKRASYKHHQQRRAEACELRKAK